MLPGAVDRRGRRGRAREIAWRAHRRSATVPAPTSAHAVEHAGLAAEVGLGQVGAVPRRRPQPFDRDVAVVVVQRGEQAGQREQRVRRGAAELAAVQRALERAQRDRELAVAAQGRAQRRLAELPVAAVGDHHHVGAHQLGVAVDDPAAGSGGRSLSDTTSNLLSISSSTAFLHNLLTNIVAVD